MTTCVTSAISSMRLLTASRRNSSRLLPGVGTGRRERNCDSVPKTSVADGRFAGASLQHFSRSPQTRLLIPWEGR